MNGTKFRLALAVFAVATTLLVFGHIDQTVWQAVVLGNVFVYAGGNIGATVAHGKAVQNQ